MYVNMNIKSVLNRDILCLYGLPYGADGGFFSFFYFQTTVIVLMHDFLYISLFGRSTDSDICCHKLEQRITLAPTWTFPGERLVFLPGPKYLVHPSKAWRPSIGGRSNKCQLCLIVFT